MKRDLKFLYLANILRCHDMICIYLAEILARIHHKVYGCYTKCNIMVNHFSLLSIIKSNSSLSNYSKFLKSSSKSNNLELCNEALRMPEALSLLKAL